MHVCHACMVCMYVMQVCYAYMVHVCYACMLQMYGMHPPSWDRHQTLGIHAVLAILTILGTILDALRDPPK
jgi:hypothetical protein